jgi:hypothetical protein
VNTVMNLRVPQMLGNSRVAERLAASPWSELVYMLGAQCLGSSLCTGVGAAAATTRRTVQTDQCLGCIP